MPTVRTVITAIYLLAFLCLACFGIWDVWNIINDFNNDNQFTSVKSIDVADQFPFLNDVEICLKYEYNYPYPRPVSNATIFFPMALRHWNSEDITKSKNGTWDEETARATLDSYMYYLISLLDTNGIDDNYLFNEPQKFTANTEEWHSLVDKFITTPEKLARVQQALKMIQNLFGGMAPGASFYTNGEGQQILLQAGTLRPRPPRTYQESLGNEPRISPCFSIPIQDHIRPSNNSQQYAFNLAPRMTDVFTAGVSFYFRGQEFHLTEEKLLQTKQYQTLSITISNSGVFDTSEFPPCSEKYQNADDCLYDLKMDAIVEFCGCQPLGRWMMMKMPETTEKACTTAIYKKCWKRANAEAHQRIKQAKMANMCKPCVFAKNICTATTQTSSEPYYSSTASSGGKSGGGGGGGGGGGRPPPRRRRQAPPGGGPSLANQQRPMGSPSNSHSGSPVDASQYDDKLDLMLVPGENGNVYNATPRTILEVTCLDRTYILFQDKPQFSLSQLVSQVGGDLGLYIGFSMISFLEAILFVYHMFQKRRESKQPAISRQRKWTDGFGFFVRYILRSFNISEDQDDAQAAAPRGQQQVPDQKDADVMNQLYATEGRLQLKIRSLEAALEALKRECGDLQELRGKVGSESRKQNSRKKTRWNPILRKVEDITEDAPV